MMLLLLALACGDDDCPEGTERYDDVCLGTNSGAAAVDTEDGEDDTGDGGDTGDTGDTGEQGDTSS